MNKKVSDFEVLQHTADLKIAVFGKTLEELFQNAVIGMFQSMGPVNKNCMVKDHRLICESLPLEHAVSLTSLNKNILLVDFLSEALFLSDVHNEAYLNTKIIELTEKSIKALLYGIDVERFDIEIKAVTFHDLDIEQENDTWKTEIVFDI